MPVLLIRHRVTDYDAWKEVFDEHGDSRRANGSHGGRLFRNATDPSETLILLDWDDIDRARLFAQSDDLREAMGRSGLVDEPDIWLLDEMGWPPV